MSELVGVYLDLIAAKAKQLAEDYKRGKLWEGDLTDGLSDVRETLEKVANLSLKKGA